MNFIVYYIRFVKGEHVGDGAVRVKNVTSKLQAEKKFWAMVKHKWNYRDAKVTDVRREVNTIFGKWVR